MPQAAEYNDGVGQFNNDTQEWLGPLLGINGVGQRAEAKATGEQAKAARQRASATRRQSQEARAASHEILKDSAAVTAQASRLKAEKDVAARTFFPFFADGGAFPVEAVTDGEPLPGSVCEQFIRCGKAGCRCQEGHLHGPYYYRIWREGDRVKKVYIKTSDVEEVRLQCDAYRRQCEQLRALEVRYAALAGCIRRHMHLSKRLQQAVKESSPAPAPQTGPPNSRSY